MITLHLRKSVSHSLSLLTFHYSLLTVLLLALWPAPQAFAVSPAPDGGYPGQNTAEGDNALFSLTTGVNNTANGAFALSANTTGNNNAGTGFGVLYNNMSGSRNTANGVYALYSNTIGDTNTANGFEALFSNTTGSENTANGSRALFNNTTGTLNTANGSRALFTNTTGSRNTANGALALFNNTTIGVAIGADNTANGYQALYSNTTGYRNNTLGSGALYNNMTGKYNNAIGADALYTNTTSYGNNALGDDALYFSTGNGNTAVGDLAGDALTTGSGNVCIGQNVHGVAGESNTTRIRNVYASVASDRAVYVNSDDKLGTLASSRRYKEEIKPMNKASEALLGLKPVTFRYKQELDPHHVPMFGLIAEEVEKVNPDLVTRNKKGEVETVRYDAINAMLLNEFLKEHRKLQELKLNAGKQEATIAKQQKQIEALTAGLQRVGAQVNVWKSAEQMVIKNH